MLPDGSYYASQTSASASINKDRSSMLHFLASNSLKTLLNKDFECCTLTVTDSHKPIKAIPLDVLALYWRHWDRKGDPIAATLVNGLIQKSLLEVADEAFGVQRHTVLNQSNQQDILKLHQEFVEISQSYLSLLQQSVHQNLTDSSANPNLLNYTTS